MQVTDLKERLLKVSILVKQFELVRAADIIIDVGVLRGYIVRRIEGLLEVTARSFGQVDKGLNDAERTITQVIVSDDSNFTRGEFNQLDLKL